MQTRVTRITRTRSAVSLLLLTSAAAAGSLTQAAQATEVRAHPPGETRAEQPGPQSQPQSQPGPQSQPQPEPQPTVAQAEDQDTRPVGTFRITLHDGARTSDPVLARATLNCFPSARSTHPRARRACATLARVQGDFAALPKHNRPCTMAYKPVTVVAEGTWNGRASGYAHTYPNRCVAHAHSAGVFDLGPR
ncbi:SSI family serine proteinase inhibitor [Streptomyces iconiensis]|uniref:SSI family serine proteinase inhibitor n=1 Tax=Streptomyces iconiensis TaxID=1384038 RepID=A0ABT6ZW71_9ACTN|nr:SSI family serine proteinase inhibitor [Streptomyces iconiensis]MDJ1133321.1 SSI family serine proteinase inhibitor [Streptomyces iconiensis]